MAGEFFGIIPPELLDPKRKEDVIALIIKLPVDIMTKKYLLLAWAKAVGVKLDAEDIQRVTGWRAEETRG